MYHATTDNNDARKLDVTYVFQDTEEALVMNLRDSQVLNHKENLEWNWNLIGTILKVSINRAG